MNLPISCLDNNEMHVEAYLGHARRQPCALWTSGSLLLLLLLLLLPSSMTSCRLPAGKAEPRSAGHACSWMAGGGAPAFTAAMLK
jgi:hypothetical protein